MRILPNSLNNNTHSIKSLPSGIDYKYGANLENNETADAELCHVF